MGPSKHRGGQSTSLKISPPENFPGIGFPVGFVVPVPAVGKGFSPGTGIETAGGGDVLRCFRTGGAAAKQNRDQNYRGYPFFSCSAAFHTQFPAPVIPAGQVCYFRIRFRNTFLTLPGSFRSFCSATAAASAPARYTLFSGSSRTASRKDWCALSNSSRAIRTLPCI